jgi:carbon monoxide dehydrogenase subunit G
VRIENSFEVPAPPEQAWELLMDVPRVIPCMPGATLAETIDDDHWKAKLAVKLGPIALNFDADIAREAGDPEARRAVLSTRARESKGRGSANATIESSLAASNGGTRVDIATDLQLAGAVAQYGRGMVESVASQLTASFAECLKAQLVTPPAAAGTEAGAEPAAAAPAAARPVGGLRLGLRALLDVLTKPFRRRR